MRRLIGVLLLTSLSVWTTGCMSQDEARSFYLHADGHVEMVLDLQNVASSQKGLDAKVAEKHWLRELNSGKTQELTLLRRAGAVGIQTQLTRSESPFSAQIRARFPSVTHLARFYELQMGQQRSRLEVSQSKSEKGGPVRVVVVSEARRKPTRGLASRRASKGQRPVPWKFVPVDGKIESASGFEVIDGGSAALLDANLLTAFADRERRFELSLRW